MVERKAADTKNMRFLVVPNRTKATLTEVLRAHVDLQSWIFTDGWSAHRGLSEIFTGHHYCNNSLHFVNYKDPIFLE